MRSRVTPYSRRLISTLPPVGVLPSGVDVRSAEFLANASAMRALVAELRGALATVDRSYGWLMDELIHHIADTHVVHHMFHEVPFYNAVEATSIVRDALGPYYLSDHTSIPFAVFRAFHACKFVEDDGLVVHYKDAKMFNKAQKAQ